MTNIIAVAADHAGYDYKEALKPELAALGWQVLDCGTHSTERTDFPAYARKVTDAITGGQARCGLLICGTGFGMGISANRVKGIRAAVVHDITTARLAREHNDANVICLGARIIGLEVAKDSLKTFITTDFLGGRYQERISQLD